MNKAQEMFERVASWPTDGRGLRPCGLDAFVSNILARGGFTVPGLEWDDPDYIDRERVRAAVMDGSIRSVRNLGKISLAKICIWLWPEDDPHSVPASVQVDDYTGDDEGTP